VHRWRSGQPDAAGVCGSERLSPSWLDAESKAALGGAGGPCRGRCKYVPVSSMAPSMAPTPLHDPPAPPLTISCRVQPRKRKKKSKSGSLATLALCRPRSTPTNSRACQQSQSPVDPRHAWMIHSISDRCADQRWAPTNSRRNLSGVGRCGWAGPLAPWMAPSSPHGWVYGVSCPATPPRHPT